MILSLVSSIATAIVNHALSNSVINRIYDVVEAKIRSVFHEGV